MLEDLSMNIKQLVIHVSCLSALVAAAACNNDTPTGNLEVAFEIGSGVPCDNVEDVTVKLIKFGAKPDVDGVLESTAELTVDCSAGKALLTSVETGKYNVIVEGTDAEKTVVVDNGLTAATDLAEVLEGSDTSAGTIKLSPTPAKLLFRWELNGFLDQCDKVPLKNFEIIGYKNAGKSPIAMGAFACDAPVEDPVDFYRQLPDPDRDLDGDELDSIEIAPQDATGNTVGARVVFNITPPGAGKTVKLSVSTKCTDTTCDLECAASPCAQD